jgi:hypothetical protein
MLTFLGAEKEREGAFSELKRKEREHDCMKHTT